MVTLDEFSRLVSEIYASSVEPDNWTVALSGITRVLGATGCGVFTRDGTTRTLVAATVPPEARDSYIAYYHSMDYVLDAVEQGPAGLIHGGRALVALKAHSEFECDFMRPYNLDDGLFVRLTAGGKPTTFLAAAAKKSNPFDTDERVRFMGALVPHLQQALRTQSRVAELGNRARDITAVLDAIRYGLVMIEAGCGVTRLNFAAEQILRSRDGLCLHSGRVQANSASTDEHLQISIARACGKPRTGPRSGDSLTCSRPSARRPYIIHAVPLATAENGSTGKALLMIIDPEQEAEPPKALLKRLFGLTNAEADVALRVMRGDGLKPMSDDLSLSVATVKTHLQHVFDKTDTHRQAELVRLLLAMNP